MKNTILFLAAILFLFGCDDKIETRELVAFNSGSNSSGSFFLGSGSINERPVYKYLYKENGGIKMGYYSSLRSTVYEIGEGDNPRVIITDPPAG